MSRAEDVVAALRSASLTVAAAESLTGGLVCGQLTEVPGASTVVRGGVISYATGVKESVLGVDADLLAEHGAVHPDVAAAMAEGVCRVLGADVGLATTGVAGPEPTAGMPVGTVFVAVAIAGETPPTVVRRLDLAGERGEIRRATVDAALALLLERLARLRLP